MTKNLGFFERLARIVGGSIFLFLSFAVFEHPVARLLVILFGLWAILEGISGACPLYHTVGIRKPDTCKPEIALQLMVAGTQVAIGYVWWHAGWEKISSGDFVATLPATVSAFAAGNPFGFMTNVLTNQAIRYADLIGFLVQYSQYLIGVILIAVTYTWLVARVEETRRASLYLACVALGMGAIMNALFYFAAGHLSPSTASLNVLMFWVELVMIYGYVNILSNRSSRSRG